MLGTLAVMLAGSVMATVASAGGGPFWYHRPVGEVLGNGLKIAPNAPENFKGKGGLQTLVGNFSGETVEIKSSSVQVKGAIFNNGMQGQIKVELIYNQPEVVKPIGKPCVASIGQNNRNIVVVKGHLMWKWNGEPKQLEEQKQEAQKPDIVFTPAELQQGAGGLPAGEFTSITFKGAGCGLLGSAGAQKVTGSEVGLPSPSQVGEWSRTLAVRTMPSGGVPNLWQHFWNGEKFIGVKAGLKFAESGADLIGQTESEAEQQEISVKES